MSEGLCSFKANRNAQSMSTLILNLIILLPPGKLSFSKGIGLTADASTPIACATLCSADLFAANLHFQPAEIQ